MRKRKQPSGFQVARDRLSLYQRLVDAGLSPEQANHIAAQVTKGIWDIQASAIRNATGRAVVELPKAG